ncbi:hypothetical protein [Spiroplasma endosymbiont of Nebria brevicollis]|uniref:hypothetical protein n=1 Tax=Spiroplasma endosymbiont of Nebria brevicollis TaxID=3066284 RepID=UPI00313D9F90
MKEFGLVYYEIGKPIEISTAGHKLVHSMQQEKSDLEEQVLLNILIVNTELFISFTLIGIFWLFSIIYNPLCKP